jgi:hypothetical protein
MTAIEFLIHEVAHSHFWERMEVGNLEVLEADEDTWIANRRDKLREMVATWDDTREADYDMDEALEDVPTTLQERHEDLTTALTAALDHLVALSNRGARS